MSVVVVRGGGLGGIWRMGGVGRDGREPGREGDAVRMGGGAADGGGNGTTTAKRGRAPRR